MKSIVKFLTCFSVLFIVSCIDPHDMLTVINPDGSCYREFTSTVNKEFVMGDSINKNNPFPVDIDSTWNISWKFRDSEWFTQPPKNKSTLDSIILSKESKNKLETDKKKESDSFYAVVHKNYSSVEEMSEKFKFKKSHEWSTMKVKYEFDKEFRWFYTYYSYREIYPRINTNFEIPIDKYMSKDESMFWFTGQPNLVQGMNGVEMREYLGDLEDKYNKWFAQNSWNNLYKVLIENYDQIKNKPVPKERFAQMKDTIFNTVAKEVQKEDMDKILNKYFKTDAFSVLWKDDDSPMRKSEKDFDKQEFVQYFGEAFNYKLIMPGKIIQSNNALIQSDTLNWRLTAYRMFPADYVIEAQSRKANIWTFILTGIIMLLAIGSFLWKPRKRN